ncbi:hypothetical protein [Kitasatospora griseola]|uniref:hypothetical protein n=1 Tax=Kitasatospora griseola TaxID=2064 RepID=UPI0016704972|nr:hypothetical protein [Kitasatospora griseola]GGQ73483.1 hypothetical protein GCM10010195_31440 [Kitasatospora griseola]
MNGTRGAGRSGRGVAYALLTLLGCGVLVGLAVRRFGEADGTPVPLLVASVLVLVLTPLVLTLPLWGQRGRIPRGR